MAKAKVKSEKRVTLKLSEREAEVLRQVCNKVGGDPTGPRGCIDAVSSALDAAGVNADDAPARGSIIFEAAA